MNTTTNEVTLSETNGTMVLNADGTGTLTLHATRKVVKAVIAGREMALRPDTTDLNACDRLAPYVRGQEWTWGYAGPKNASTIVIVSVRHKRSEPYKAGWDRAAQTLAKLLKKYEA
jgi:hypothetical protein